MCTIAHRTHRKTVHHPNSALFGGRPEKTEFCIDFVQFQGFGKQHSGGNPLSSILQFSICILHFYSRVHAPRRVKTLKCGILVGFCGILGCFPGPGKLPLPLPLRTSCQSCHPVQFFNLHYSIFILHFYSRVHAPRRVKTLKCGILVGFCGILSASLVPASSTPAAIHYLRFFILQFSICILHFAIHPQQRPQSPITNSYALIPVAAVPSACLTSPI